MTERPITLVNCFVCDKEMKAIYESSPMQPYGGLMCVASGNDGSTIFDPFHSSGYIGFIVCDDCMTERMERTRYVKTERVKPVVKYLDTATAIAPDEFDEDPAEMRG